MSLQSTFDAYLDRDAWFVELAEDWFCEGLPPETVIDAKVSWLQLEAPVASGTPRRALYWDGAIIREITDALLGTGKKPIVLLSGALKERATSEGDAVIIVNGGIRCLDPVTETLLI